MNQPHGGRTDPITELADACSARRRPDRFHARAVLLALGQRVLAGDLQAVASLGSRVKEVTAARRESWEAAVREELLLACTEHVRSVDPRFLRRPDYDLQYVLGAREDLQARLEAAEALGIEPPEGLVDRVVAADRLLEPLLGERPSPQVPPEGRSKGAADRWAGS